MRKLVLGLAAAMALGLCVRVSNAADNDKKVSGVLIDDHCVSKFADKDDPEKAAAKHPAACCVKCAKDSAQILLLSGKKQMKLDKHGQELAMDYLSKPKAKTAVTITGTVTGDEIKVDSIEPKESDASKG